MKIIPVWTAFTTVDEYGRNGELLGVFLTEPMAKKAAEGHGWYGGNGNVSERRAIVAEGRTEDKVYLLDDEYTSVIPLGTNLVQKMKDLKKKALAKLSSEEKELLGIEEEE